MAEEWLLCIGAGPHQTAVLRRAREMGLRTLAVDLNPNAPGRELADAFICHSAWDAGGIYEKLSADLRAGIRGVVTQAARGCTVTAPLLAQRLGLPHLNPETAALFLDKERALRRYNASIRSYSSAGEIPAVTSLPCVVKFLSTSGGLGNHLVQTNNDLERLASLKGEVVVEPFVDGRHLGIIGLACADKVKIYGIIERVLRHDMTIDYAVFPALLDAADIEKLLPYARLVLTTSGLDFGPFQVELILADEGHIHFVELEPSILGSYISEWMIPAASENDMIEDAICLAMGQAVDFEVLPSAGIAINKYYYADDPLIQCGGPFPESFRFYGSNGVLPADSRQYVANELVYVESFEPVEDMMPVFPESSELPGRS